MVSHPRLSGSVDCLPYLATRVWFEGKSSARTPPLLKPAGTTADAVISLELVVAVAGVW